MYTETVLEKISDKTLLFQVPTTISNLEPIFVFKIQIAPQPSFAINLNPILSQDTLMTDSANYLFNSDGYCSFVQNYQNDYFINGDLKLLDFNDSGNNELSHCKMSITYGRGKSEIFYLKGIFKLSEFEQN